MRFMVCWLPKWNESGGRSLRKGYGVRGRGQAGGRKFAGRRPGNKSGASRFRRPAYKHRRICYGAVAPSVSTGRQGDGHGQGTDAQQQGKEETEGRQEPQKGRRRARQPVRG